MRSTKRDRMDDLTARARIRDAALRLFGESGYRGTSIRDVAREAGVSGGLVQHHFGTKEGLRDACDAHVLETLRWTTEAKLGREQFDTDFVSALYAATNPILKYVARGLAEGWPGSVQLFDQSVDGTVRWLEQAFAGQFADAEAVRRRAATMVAMSLGAIVLHGHLARQLGSDPLDWNRYQRLGLEMLDVYEMMGGFVTTPKGRAIRESAAEYDRRVSGEDE